LHGVSNVRNDVKSNNVQGKGKKVPVAEGWEEQNTKGNSTNSNNEKIKLFTAIEYDFNRKNQLAVLTL
jgi:hypothetical protein